MQGMVVKLEGTCDKKRGIGLFEVRRRAKEIDDTAALSTRTSSAMP